MKLIDDAGKAWKFFSVQANVLNLALLGAWATVPEDMKAGIPQQYLFYASVALLVLGTVGRLVKQGE
jgi:hypothetical protein